MKEKENISDKLFGGFCQGSEKATCPNLIIKINKQEKKKKLTQKEKKRKERKRKRKRK